MQSTTAPIPPNELDRIVNLYKFDTDYSNLESTFSDLTFLAAKICGTDISQVNFIDSDTQWSVANYGADVAQMAREDSVCQFTILEDEHFEVEDLSVDGRFSDKSYVANPLNLRYYFGVPLKTISGHNIGSLCVFDKDKKKLSPEKIELLKVIANEIIAKLNTIKVVQKLKTRVMSEKETIKKVAHDIRGPISGIIGLSEIIGHHGEENKISDVLELVTLIHNSGKSVLELADEILTEHKEFGSAEDDFNLSVLKEKLIKLYASQAKYKNIEFVVDVNEEHKLIPLSKDNLLQIVSNLVSNAMKFTSGHGFILVDLKLDIVEQKRLLKLSVTDSGIGMTKQVINKILQGKQTTSHSLEGERGYGFGLTMVKHLVDGLNGTMEISSIEGAGTKFEISIPQ